MIFNLFRVPIGWILAALVFIFVFGKIIPHQLGRIDFLVNSGLVNSSIEFAGWGGLAFIVIGLVLALYNGFRFWQWYQCKGEYCFDCGGIANFEIGRWGSFSHCLACGRKRSY